MKVSSSPLVSVALVMLATACPALAAPWQTQAKKAGVSTAPPPQAVTAAHKLESLIPLAPPNPIPIAALPFTITQPGYYRVTGDLTGISGDNGILVDASDVVIDLDGFTLVGVTGSLTGIRTSNQTGHLTVLNGSLALWGDGGLFATSDTRLFGVEIRHCTGDGSVVLFNARFQDCQVISNGGRGIVAQGGLTVIDSIVTANGGDGIRAIDDGYVANCQVFSNGDDGIELSDRAQVIGCSLQFNTSSGLETGTHAIVRDTTSRLNGASAFDLRDSSRIEGCFAQDNGKGIAIGKASHVVDCTSISNGLEGITGLEGTLIQRCIVSANQRGIILSGEGSRVSDCYIENNVDDGLGVSGNTTVERNSVQGNGSRGIFAVNGGNRIDGNDVTDNGVGIAVLAGNNLIVRNTLAFNGVQMQIAPDNQQGPLLKAKGFIQDTNPWANFDLSFPAAFP